MSITVSTRGAANLTLADLDVALQADTSLPPVRRRDLRSAVSRVADLLSDDPARIALDLPAIAAGLAVISPAAVALSAKSFANIRAGFTAAVQTSGLLPKAYVKKSPLAPAWAGLIAQLSPKRWQIGLSRLARFASSVGIDPVEVGDKVIADFLAAVRDGSLHPRPNDLHRRTAVIWNEVAAGMPEFSLALVTIPSFRPPPQRIDWNLLSDAFRQDVEAYFDWCAGADVFAADARPRRLAPRTRKLRRDEIHAAATALIASGVAVATIRSLADLVAEDSFRRILRRRHDAAGGKANSFNHALAKALIQIAREWVKVDVGALDKLKRMTAKLPQLSSGLVDRNKRFLRQFDDPAAFARLVNLPQILWSEVRRDAKPNFRTLAKAQAAIAIALLTYIPLRSHNLVSLTFGTHLFLNDDVRATSTLELAGHEVKNGSELAFDIPPVVARMLIEYRDSVAPNIIGRRPERLFENVDGSPKSQAGVAWLISTNVYRRTGIEIAPHQFRHLSARVLLDAEPGNFEGAKQLLGHKSLRTTVAAYAGIDSRRAARHHQRLIDQALEAQARAPRAGRAARNTKKPGKR